MAGVLAPAMCFLRWREWKNIRGKCAGFRQSDKIAA
jgi:hypothetical protein